MDKIKTIAALGLGFLLFSSFRKKGTSEVSRGYIIPSNLPTGVKLVYSKVGTIIYDRNFNEVYTYETPNYGIAVTGTKGYEMYSVVIGNDFLNGIQGFVFKNDVTEK
jgi:hypothetical protein